MMLTEALPASAPLDMLPPPRSTMPTLPFELEEYARQSCLPDADDELVFEAGPPLAAITSRVPHPVARVEIDESLSDAEAFMLSLVDGIAPVSRLIELVGVAAEEALVVICDLYARGLVAFD
jgi:hypothetical protein